MPESSLTFRVGTVNDAAEVVALVHSAYRGDASRQGWTTEADFLDGDRISEEAMKSTLAADDGRVLLAYADDTLIGCCHVQRRIDQLSTFGMFAVSPTAQGGGLGRTILGYAEVYAQQEWRTSIMELSAIAQRAELIAWYERRGYVRTGERREFPYDDPTVGLPRRDDLYFVVLTKALTAAQ